MRSETTIQGATFSGTSDLTIVATIKKGFVPSLDAVTYKTRVKRVLKSLHLGRQTAHEYEFARVLSDAVERVGRIHSIRIAIIEPEGKVMLAVTFDGSWESYIRVIWQKVSRSLDLIFCNTEDYVTGWGHSFEEWCQWLRRSQAESLFLYSPPGLTYQDTIYLRTFERRLRRDSDDIKGTQIRIPTAEDIADQMCADATDPSNSGLDLGVDILMAGRPAFRQGMRSLVGLFRLIEVHLPGTPDGEILHRAATELLREFVWMLRNPGKYEDAIERAEARFKEALDWLRRPMQLNRPIPELPTKPPLGELADVQGGIVDSYPDVSDGCLVLVAADSPLALGQFLSAAEPTKATDTVAANSIVRNVALTLEGLRLAGLDDDEIAALPKEFVEGMEKRAGMLGDVRINHPRRWRRPAINWAQGVNAQDVSEEDSSPRVDLASVHLIIQLRMCNSSLTQGVARSQLLSALTPLFPAQSGVRALSIQWMNRMKASDGTNREHFGFLDSQSRPVLTQAAAGTKFKNQVHLGEILLGYENAADGAPLPLSPKEIDAHPDPATMRRRNASLQLLRNGSFLVVRKLRQDLGKLEEVLEAGVDEALVSVPPPTDPADQAQQRKAERDLLLAKMMGRWPSESATPGKAMISSVGNSDNDFNFNNDAGGSLCPFHAHIRRANPRDTSLPEPPGARPARLIRRGMSYGPEHDLTATGDAKAQSLARERGMVFMAYNASIGEQFEVVQRWLSGGNSSASYSGQSDPFLGVAEPGRKRFFRFEHDDKVVRMPLDGSDLAHDVPRPIVRLEWGMYLFTPSIPALRLLSERAKKPSSKFVKSWSEEEGEKAIAELRRLEAAQGFEAAFTAWKVAIEDPASATEFTAASIWAAIRRYHGGVLDTPLGALAASRDAVDAVLLDRDRNLTATGYLPRMHRSFGPLYLGMDAGQIAGVYELESVEVNAAIMKLVERPEDFTLTVAEAAKITSDVIDGLANTAIADAKEDYETHWEVTFEAREVIDQLLARFCEKWFGLSDRGKHLQCSGVRWDWKPGNPEDPPCYPGHFMAPSRYTFQPHPGPDVERIGAENGLALRVAVTNYLAEFGSKLVAPVARAVLDCEAARLDSGAPRPDPGYPARTLAGVLMGFLPTTDGNMRRVLNEWLTEGTLWSLRAQHSAMAPSDADADADARKALTRQMRRKFIEAMQLRAAPELLWRTAARGHQIGAAGPHEVSVRPGQIVIASLISATQQCLEEGKETLAHAFGGDRRAPHPPTHACPGYGPAEAVMLGFFQGLIESPQALRAGPGPLSFYMDGHLALDEDPQEALAALRDTSLVHEAAFGVASHATVTAEAAKAATTPILVIGDSWLTDLGDFSFLATLAASLRGLGYRFDPTLTTRGFRDVGMQLSTIAQAPVLDAIRQYFADLTPTGYAPKAVMIGAGGNDLVDPAKYPKQTRLYRMLVESATDPDGALIEDEVKALIDKELFGHYVNLLEAIIVPTEGKIPLLLHAYAYPIPDSRRFEGKFGWGKRGPWLGSVFAEKKIALTVSTKVMETLIKRLNEMLKRLETKYPGVVHHVDLTEAFPKIGGYPANYKDYWANELHASTAGFDILAKVVQTKLKSLGI